MFKRKIIGIVLLSVFLNVTILTSCSKNRTDYRVLLDELDSRYSRYLEEIENYSVNISMKESSIRAFRERNVELIEENDFGGTYELFSIQGESLETGRNELREQIAYKRLMGHMDFYSVIEEDSFATYFKVFDPKTTLDHLEFVGIVKISVPFENFYKTLSDLDFDSSEFFILDSNKKLITYPSKEMISISEKSKLIPLVKKLSLLKKEEGEIVLTDDLSGIYSYKIGERSVIGIKITK